MSARTTQLLSSGEFCKLRYDTIPVKRSSANVSFCTNNSKMPNFELWHSCHKYNCTMNRKTKTCMYQNIYVHYTWYRTSNIFFHSQLLCLLSLHLWISHIIILHFWRSSPSLWTTHYILSICIHITHQKPHNTALIKSWRTLGKKTLKPFQFWLISHKNKEKLCDFMHLLYT